MNETSTQRRKGATAYRTDGGSHPFAGSQLVVVSNRQPYRHSETDDGEAVAVDRPTGGLTAGLDPVVQETGGTWVAWGDGDADRDVVDEADRVGVPPEDPAYTLRRVWLSDEQVANYYYGFSNQVVWPLCHGALGNVASDPEFWEAYQRTNRQFADVVVEEASDRSTIWFQDYHFGLAPAMVRRTLGGEPTLLQFWHIPWPGWDTYRACPHRAELLRGLLANDVLGVHVPRYRDNFLQCVRACIDDATVDTERNEVTYRGSSTMVVASPMGVPAEKVRQGAADVSAADFAAFRAEHGIPEDVAVAVGVDRLDYTKGIVARLEALEYLWETQPEWQDQLTFVQNGSESRSAIPAYDRTQSAIREAVDRINDRFGTKDWQPVVFFTDTISQDELYGLYRYADAALVTAMRDGLNLVAMEYAAAQVDEDGALLLSDGTGAHDLLGEYAYSISPFDAADIAETLASALSAPAAERRARMTKLRQQVADVDLATWLNHHGELAASAKTRPARQSGYDPV